MIGSSPYHSRTLGLVHQPRLESIGRRDWNKVFKPDMLNACRIGVLSVGEGMKGQLQWLDLLFL
jgi:hypothetical protein